MVEVNIPQQASVIQRMAVIKCLVVREPLSLVINAEGVNETA